MTAAAPAPIDPALFASNSPLRLAGATCPHCDVTTFPAQSGCPRCAAADMERVELPATGTLWTWTVQCFEPKSPYVGGGEFEPFAVGYIDLGCVIVESRLVAGSLAELTPGCALELTGLPVRTGEDAVALGYAFTPVRTEQR